MPDVYHVIGNPLGQELPPRSPSGCISGLPSNDLSLGSQGIPILPQDIETPLERSKFPDIKYWTQNEYDKKTPQSDVYDPDSEAQQDPDQPSKSLRFIQYFNGDTIVNRDAKELRISLRRCFTGILEERKKLGSKIAKSFTKLSFDERKTIRKQIYEGYPYLRLCSGHFKVDQVAIGVYPDWKKTAKKNENKRSSQSKDPKQKGKRAGEESTEGPRKKHKKDKSLSKSSRPRTQHAASEIIDNEITDNEIVIDNDSDDGYTDDEDNKQVSHREAEGCVKYNHLLVNNIRALTPCLQIVD